MSPYDTVVPDQVMSWKAALVIGLWLLPVLFWFARSVLFDQLRRFLALPWRWRISVLLILAFSTLTGADKSPVSASSIFKLLFWDPGQPWQRAAAKSALDGAALSVESAGRDLDFVDAETSTNDVVELSRQAGRGSLSNS